VRRWLAVLDCAVMLLGVGCSRPVELPPVIEIEHEIFPEPSRVGPATIAFRLSDATGKPLTGAHIGIEADMSHPGMSPLFAEAQETEPGRYQAHLHFQMAGDWVILLHVTLPDGRKLERQIDVRGVRPGVQSN
jgi:YtkA-like